MFKIYPLKTKIKTIAILNKNKQQANYLINRKI